MTSYDLLYYYIRFTFYVHIRTQCITMYTTTVERFKLFVISQHDCKIISNQNKCLCEIHFFQIRRNYLCTKNE